MFFGITDFGAEGLCIQFVLPTHLESELPLQCAHQELACTYLVPLLSGNVLLSQVATYFGTFPIENFLILSGAVSL